jgi:hypothetical protein
MMAGHPDWSRLLQVAASPCQSRLVLRPLDTVTPSHLDTSHRTEQRALAVAKPSLAEALSPLFFVACNIFSSYLPLLVSAGEAFAYRSRHTSRCRLLFVT